MAGSTASSDGDSLRAARFRVEGRVQGVGFRWATRRCADRIGVSGWVRNREDGAVEGAARGSAEELDRMKTFLERGPLAARVDRLEFVEIPASRVDADGFLIRE